MKKPIHILGRRWFQKTYGNTYHSVTISYDDGSKDELPVQYGYGEQFIETALAHMHEQGIIDRGERRENGTWPLSGTRGLREQLSCSYDAVDVSRKKDL